MITTAQVLGWMAENSLARVPVEFIYDTDDPWAVRLVFAPATVWHFGLELLSDGLRWAVGEGDVRLWPVDRAVMLHLRAPAGSALIALPLAEVSRFVDRAEGLAGQTPEVSIDRELDELLGRSA
jgi:hypothetical protein